VKSLILSALVAGTLLYGESSVGININDEDLELTTSIDLNRFGGYSESTVFTIDADLLHTENDNLLGVGVSAESQMQGLEGLTMGIGLKTVTTEDYFALPLLLKASYALPFDSVIPTTSLGGYIAYAPSVLSFSDADEYLEWRVQLDMEVVNNIHLFTGYRDINTDYKTGSFNFNDSFYGGFKLDF